jgi:hypothetical protein
LDSDLDHLLDRDREMVGRAARVACQEWVMEKTPAMSACEAMTVAALASMTAG